MISHEYKIIFIHQRRTAGRSIIASFGIKKDDEDRHLFNDGPLMNTWNQKDKIAKDYLIFTVVRNPWDRFVSGWTYLKAYNDKPISWVLDHLPCLPTQNENQKLRLLQGAEKYVYQKKLRTQAHDYRHLVRPQLSILCEKNGGFIPDFILRFEHLQRDYTKLCEIIGKQDTKLPFMGKIEREPYTKYYDSESVERVRELFSNDIEFFGYEFGKDSFKPKEGRGFF